MIFNKGHDFSCKTWPIYRRRDSLKWEVTYSCNFTGGCCWSCQGRCHRYDSFVRDLANLHETWLIGVILQEDFALFAKDFVRDMTNSYETWLIHTRHNAWIWRRDSCMWDVLHSFETQLIYSRMLPNFPRTLSETWLIHLRLNSCIWNTTPSYETWLIHLRLDSFVWNATIAYVIWLIHMKHDSSTAGCCSFCQGPCCPSPAAKEWLPFRGSLLCPVCHTALQCVAAWCIVMQCIAESVVLFKRRARLPFCASLLCPLLHKCVLCENIYVISCSREREREEWEMGGGRECVCARERGRRGDAERRWMGKQKRERDCARLREKKREGTAWERKGERERARAHARNRWRAKEKEK